MFQASIIDRVYDKLAVVFPRINFLKHVRPHERPEHFGQTMPISSFLHASIIPQFSAKI